MPTNFFNSLGLTRPSAIIRHRISSGTLQDLFVSVIEPFNAGVSNITSVTQIPMSGSPNESAGLKVTFKDGRVDTYLINLHNPQVAGASAGSPAISTADGRYSLTGRVGLCVDQSTNTPIVWSMNASDFKFPDGEWNTPTNTYFSGLIAGETRKLDGAANDAFTTTTPLPLGAALRNKWLSFTHGALSGSGTTGIREMFKLDQVLDANGLFSICFTNDHDLEITNGAISAEQVAPLRTFTTSNSFEIALSAEARQISAVADQTIAPGESTSALPFTFGNVGNTPGASLQVLASSSNQTLVPSSNLLIGGSGTNRTITITPAANQMGASLITLSVTDGTWTNSRSFNVTVSDFALITFPSTQSIFAGNTANFTNVLFATNGAPAVSYDVSGLPSGVAATFIPVTTPGAGTNILRISVSNTAYPGDYPLTITATDGSQVSTAIVTLAVNVVNPTAGWATWTGAGATGNFWSDNANWSSPPTVGNSLAFGGLLRLHNTNDAVAVTTYSNLVFNPGAGAFTLNGNPVTLAAGVTNNSSVPQTIALGINFYNNIVFNGASNTLIVAGGLTNNFGAPGAVTVALAGTGRLKNLLGSTSTPGGTNILLLNSSSANWTLIDNDAAQNISVPWIISVNNGTFNFGNFGSAPSLTSTTVNGATQDNQVGTVSGGTGIFNMVAGTFTTSARLNTATSLNSTGVVNQTGGTLNIGNQFQGANGSNPGELSQVTVSGGVMNIGSAADPSSPFYVASRGTGILTISQVGSVSCGRLDISRNAAGNSLSSDGTVNLDGGTLSVTSVTNLSANRQTGGAPVATFNFNGGTLVAKSGVPAMFFQGCRVAPITPIQTFVKSGGAIMDDGGNAITVGEPMQHDPALGSAPDGGLTKLNTGTLTLTAANTYTGDTTINAGTLALGSDGSISNSASLNLSADAIFDVSGRSDHTETLLPSQTVTGNGTLNGNFIINGAISPGADAVGTLTNEGSLQFGAGGSYLFDMSNALGQPGVNWDFILISAGLAINASSANPFVIKLRSIDTNLDDTTPGVGDFGNQTSQSWIIATAASGITNFSSDKFSVDTTGFQNDLAGGSFSVETNENSLLLVFNPPPSPPVISSVAAKDNQLVVSGTGGAPGKTYYVLASTNLAQPPNQWLRLRTNSFDPNGFFSFTNGINPGAACMFYQLQLP